MKKLLVCLFAFLLALPMAEAKKKQEPVKPAPQRPKEQFTQTKDGLNYNGLNLLKIIAFSPLYIL